MQKGLRTLAGRAKENFGVTSFPVLPACIKKLQIQADDEGHFLFAASGFDS
jgi:hypothetical protein